MKNKRWLVILCMILIVGLIQPLEAKLATGRTVMISVDILNVREGPGLSYGIVGKVKKGEAYRLLTVNGDWYEIQVKDNLRGWVANWFVTEQTSPSSTVTGTITTDGLRIRSGPDTSYSIKGILQKGAAVQILSEKDNWYEVNSDLGKGWIHSDFVETSMETVQPDGTVGKVTASILNVRNKPSLTGVIIGKLSQGDKITILSKQGEWVEVNLKDKKGWVHQDYISLTSDNEPKDEVEEEPDVPLPNPDEPVEEQTNNGQPQGMIGVVTATSLNVRDKGALDGKIIGSVKAGDSFTIVEMTNDWCKIEYNPNQFGWVAGWFLEKTEKQETVPAEESRMTVSIQHDGTNIREGADLNKKVTARANAGDTFPLVALHGDWYEIQLKDGRTAFVAGWIVALENAEGQKQESDNTPSTLHGKKILIDPGHGGKDNGTTGAQGTIEKDLTLKTSQLLYQKLEALGANVLLTRRYDQTLSLSSRVSMGHYQNVDAFISIHYDSIEDQTVRGMTTYYYYSWQRSLAATIHQATIQQIGLKNRGIRYGNYHVLRENRKDAVLLELGYLSNPTEELILTSNQYQEQVTTGITKGLLSYFSK